jgi:hypothetical protein
MQFIITNPVVAVDIAKPDLEFLPRTIEEFGSIEMLLN